MRPRQPGDGNDQVGTGPQGHQVAQGLQLEAQQPTFQELDVLDQEPQGVGHLQHRADDDTHAQQPVQLLAQEHQDKAAEGERHGQATARRHLVPHQDVARVEALQRRAKAPQRHGQEVDGKHALQARVDRPPQDHDSEGEVGDEGQQRCKGHDPETNL